MSTATAQMALCGRPADMDVILARLAESLAASGVDIVGVSEPQRIDARYPDVAVHATLATDVPRPRGGA